MRKRLIASVFIAFLFCVSAFAGHTNPGGYKCDCGSSFDCICDPGEEPMGVRVSEPDKSTQDTPIDFGSESLFALAALMLVLRYKA